MKHLTSLLIFILPYAVLAAGGQHPPRPMRGPGPPPGLPIDNNIIILFVIAIFLFIIWKRPLNATK